MKTEVNSADLCAAVNTVSHAMPAKSPNPVMEGILLDADGDAVRLTCCDGGMSIVCVCPATVEEKGRVVLPGKLFRELVKKLPTGTLNIETDGETAKIKCGKNRSRIAVMNAENFTAPSALETEGRFTISQSELGKAITRVAFAASHLEERPQLSGCEIQVTPGEIRFAALDGFRLATQTVKGNFDAPEAKLLVPAKMLSELAKILPDGDAECEVEWDKTRIQVRNGSTVFTASLIAGEFVDWEELLRKKQTTEIKVSSALLAGAIERAAIISKDDGGKSIRMSIGNDTMRVSVNASIGSMEEEIEIDAKGEPLEIAFNAKYLLDVLRSAGADEADMKFTNSISPCVVQPYGDDSAVYIVLPVRLFDREAQSA